MKHLAPQHEFRWGREDFALVAESAVDHERRQREAEQAERDRKENENRQTSFVE